MSNYHPMTVLLYALEMMKRAAHRILHRDMWIDFAGIKISLPPSHLLPIHRVLHKRYDRFLPHLAKYLDPRATVIDVGANCGDTMAAMFAVNPLLRYICVEPDPVFFEYLRTNARRIRTLDSAASVQLWQTFVGKNIVASGLAGSGGTKHAVIANDERTIPAVSLDDLLARAGVDSVMLLKSDIDGYDYDVINSAEKMIDHQSPLIFFECDFRNAEQKSGYALTIESLSRRGYENWTVFDNYGEMLVGGVTVNVVLQLLDYVERQHAGVTTRTVHYFDILASKDSDKALVGRVLKDYVACCGRN